jgi:hypothetical protein
MNADSSAGSKHAIFIMSGCYINSMENPSTSEGVTESSIEIVPESVTGSEWNSSVPDGTFQPW